MVITDRMKKTVNKRNSFVGGIWFLILFFPFVSFAQDTIPVSTLPFDTTLIENSHVDTITAKNSAAELETKIQKPFQSKFYYGVFLM